MKILKSKVLKAYGLDKEYKVSDGSSPAMLAQLERGTPRRNRWPSSCGPPHWAYSKYKLAARRPGSSFGADNRSTTSPTSPSRRSSRSSTGALKKWHMTEKETGEH